MAPPRYGHAFAPMSKVARAKGVSSTAPVAIAAAVAAWASARSASPAFHAAWTTAASGGAAGASAGTPHTGHEHGADRARDHDDADRDQRERGRAVVERVPQRG